MADPHAVAEPLAVDVYWALRFAVDDRRLPFHERLRLRRRLERIDAQIAELKAAEALLDKTRRRSARFELSHELTRYSGVEGQLFDCCGDYDLDDKCDECRGRERCRIQFEEAEAACDEAYREVVRAEEATEVMRLRLVEYGRTEHLPLPAPSPVLSCRARSRARPRGAGRPRHRPVRRCTTRAGPDDDGEPHPAGASPGAGYQGEAPGSAEQLAAGTLERREGVHP